MKGDFTSPMLAWPRLERYARRVELPRSSLQLFLFDTGPSPEPAVLLLHGLGDEADTWRHLVDPLSTNWRVIAPDLPGFGRSERPEAGYTIPFLCGVLLELLDVMEIPRVTLVGNSPGAVISQAIALSHPGRVDGLVLIDGMLLARAQKLSLQNLLFLLPRIGEWLYTRLRNDQQAAYVSLDPYYFDLAGLPKTERDFLFTRVNQRVWSDGQRRAYFSVLRQMTSYVAKQQRGLEDKLAQMEVPTLVAWGEQDQMVPLENAYALVEIQDTARLVVFPDTGHLPQQERPQERLEAFMADERPDIRR